MAAMLMNKLNKIISLILDLSNEEKHPDKVTCLHSALMRVNMGVGAEMKRMRDDER